MVLDFIKILLYLWRNVSLGTGPIFYCLVQLYILEVKPLLVAEFVNIFY